MVDTKILESEWVQPKRDKRGRETWGHELKEGAPEDVKKKFQECQEALAWEEKTLGIK
ncbi:MAG: hypothetical protein FWB75_01375 [Oscillospiraceae bacterium]|nr:hypothetical protein [Oscillospiraceae bacterium]